MARLIKTMAFCAAVTAICCWAAYQARGYIAIGGEWLVWTVVAALAAQGGETNEMD